MRDDIGENALQRARGWLFKPAGDTTVGTVGRIFPAGRTGNARPSAAVAVAGKLALEAMEQDPSLTASKADIDRPEREKTGHIDGFAPELQRRLQYSNSDGLKFNGVTAGGYVHTDFQSRGTVKLARPA